MSDRFELSLKNKEVRVWLIIMVPTVIAQILIVQFTENPAGYITGLFPLISWTIFFIWRYFYKRKKKRIQSVS
ncbi:hypothetical protein FITA111629_09145 [Filibacter tadaridae]|uniref:Uncharacterized protein n=1 Tax=Filibacter tadaridae TaxID=2483811 RepID=A0A3P5WQ51_9BACL|nr:hypothetical protein [Filibacter tadaridae]VDC21661.1 hypothetical protein FILTAD_00665 [Filibacter tadaridae]